jgi:peptidoglycan hydrolase-like protein with peptidoglycan-binding domain
MNRQRFAPRQAQGTALAPNSAGKVAQSGLLRQTTDSRQFTGGTETANNGLQPALFQLHKTVGNAAIARALAGERRTFQADVFKGDSKLEAVLNDEARLSSGNRGESVRKVQDALIRDGIELPKFGADGAYGGETESAVKQFKTKHNLGSTQFGDVGPGTMGKLDELNAGGNIVPPKPPSKDPNDVDPALEAMLDHIATDYVKMLRNQDQALVEFERDMAKPEVENPTLFTELLKLAANKLIGHLMPPPSGLLFQGVLSSFKLKASEDESGVIEKAAASGIESIFEAINTEAKAAIEKELNSTTVSGDQGSLTTFVDAQRDAMFNSTVAAMDALSNAKPDLRKFQPEDAGKEDLIGTHNDPRFDRALKLRLSVREHIDKAKDEQYLSTVQQWSAYQAQLTLGTTPTVDPQSNKDVQGTNLSDPKLADAGRTSVAGLLDIRIENLSTENARQRIRIVSVRVRGLSEKVRTQLNTKFAGKKLSEVGMPRRVMDGLPPFTAHDIRIGRNEMNSETFRTGEITQEGRAWLEERGGSESAGMVVTMDEVDNKTVAEVGGIQAPSAELV